LQILQRRFQAPAPADLVSAINAQTDPAELVRWVDAAVAAPSLEDFRAAMQR
jgi:hypothetical protein